MRTHQPEPTSQNLKSIERHEITRYVICPVCNEDAAVWDETLLDCGSCGYGAIAPRR